MFAIIKIDIKRYFKDVRFTSFSDFTSLNLKNQNGFSWPINLTEKSFVMCLKALTKLPLPTLSNSIQIYRKLKPYDREILSISQWPDNGDEFVINKIEFLKDRKSQTVDPLTLSLSDIHVSYFIPHINDYIIVLYNDDTEIDAQLYIRTCLLSATC